MESGIHGVEYRIQDFLGFPHGANLRREDEFESFEGKGVLEGLIIPGSRIWPNTVRNSRNAKLTGYWVWQDEGFVKMRARIESAGIGKGNHILDDDDRSSAC